MQVFFSDGKWFNAIDGTEVAACYIEGYLEVAPTLRRAVANVGSFQTSPADVERLQAKAALYHIKDESPTLQAMLLNELGLIAPGALGYVVENPPIWLVGALSATA